ncbi:Hypothetical predicted protein [Mytilus galloprovincialis]|uniref:Uncharacterized protein n=1 Tax=Mytilus galloprovincialis TaxID=29158 RepID=A0A8B6HDT5_MYTGA|nr:Hypothetical predicted protein [Mytilus galloprovincialis]
MADGDIYSSDDDSSFRKENILHKAIRYTRRALLQNWFASQNWDDVNTGNRWNQTPLHYAAIQNNKAILQQLLQVRGVQVKKQDLNGYNVLHSFIYNITFTTIDWKTIIQDLLSFGIDINQQTKHGYTILHLASRYISLTCVLRFILESCSGLNVTLINKDGENFLHLLVESINKGNRGKPEFINRCSLLKDIVRGEIKCCHHDTLITLLKQRDVNGKTPFLLLISHFDKYQNIEILRKMSVNGECSKIPDNLGNHPIHYAIACMRTANIDLLKMLVETGADANAKNIYEQSAAHVVRVNDVTLIYNKMQLFVNLFQTTDIELNASDKWGCNPLMSISAFYDSNCTLYLHDISKAMPVLDKVDNSGSTVLHYAAYHDSCAFVEKLIKIGAKHDIKDNLGDIPIETAKRNLRINSGEALLKFTNTKKLDQLWFEKIKPLQTFPRKDMNLNQFAEDLLDHKYRNKGEEEDEINITICSFVELLCKQVTKIDPRLKMSVFQSGSSKEKTKVNAPNEFDFVLCLDKLGEFCDIKEKRCAKKRLNNYALKLKLIEGYQDVLEFFDEDKNLITPHIFMYLHKYLNQALHDASLWKLNAIRKLCYVFEEPLLKSAMTTTVFMVNLLWFGCKHKQLKIKIDMVPAVRKGAWWPIFSGSIPMMTKTIHDAGCLLLLDTTSDEQSFTFQYSKEFIVDTIDRIRPVQSNLRVSTAPAEVCLMATLPQIVRDSYALAKLFVDICKVKNISSYMLKNCTFHVVQEIHWILNTPHATSLLPSLMNLTVMIFKKLLFYNKKYNLPRFFQPEVNILNQDDEKRFRMANRKYVRKDINLILYTLGQIEELDNDERDDDSSLPNDGSDDSSMSDNARDDDSSSPDDERDDDFSF